jgi:serine/threonine protein kinase
VAVKKLLGTSTHSLRDFIDEVAVITNVPEHQNLVQFLGCCYTRSSERFLVYEYVENKDLHKALFSEFSFYLTPRII